MMFNFEAQESAYKHPRYPEFTAELQAKAIMLGLDPQHSIGYASNTFMMGPTRRVDATTLEPLPHSEWDKRVLENYGAGVFRQWLEANPVTTEGNDG